MVDIVLATLEDARQVQDEISDISYDELIRQENAPGVSIGLVYCAKDEKGPLFLFGLSASAPGEWRTSFMATQRYFEMGANGVRILRRFARRLMADYPCHTFVCETTSMHADLHRWYAALGGKKGVVGRGSTVFTFGGP